VDKGGQGRDQMDAALMCRSFAANAVRLQLHALAYNLGNFMRTLAMPKTAEPVVTDQPARKADQDRHQGRQPRPVRHLPVGRSRGAASDVRRNPFAYRPAAGTARAGMRAQGQVRQATAGRDMPWCKQISALRRFWCGQPRLRLSFW
jgi:hypothetical protein